MFVLRSREGAGEKKDIRRPRKPRDRHPPGRRRTGPSRRNKSEFYLLTQLKIINTYNFMYPIILMAEIDLQICRKKNLILFIFMLILWSFRILFSIFLHDFFPYMIEQES